jgi:putative endonuclease
MTWLRRRALPADIGKRSEQAACQFLQENKIKIVDKNYRCRFGEIDIIGLSEHHLVFFEVRHRQSNKFGSAAETVDTRKQQRIILTARHYLGRGKYTELPCRFDVIEVMAKTSGELSFNWLDNAFQE